MKLDGQKFVMEFSDSDYNLLPFTMPIVVSILFSITKIQPDIYIFFQNMIFFQPNMIIFFRSLSSSVGAVLITEGAVEVTAADECQQKESSPADNALTHFFFFQHFSQMNRVTLKSFKTMGSIMSVCL